MSIDVAWRIQGRKEGGTEGRKDGIKKGIKEIRRKAGRN
jgi:hypothetical protein